MKNIDLFIVGLIFTIQCMCINHFKSLQEQKELNRELLLAKTIAVELDSLNKEYILMVNSLNNELDNQQELINFYEYNYKVLKDLR